MVEYDELESDGQSFNLVVGSLLGFVFLIWELLTTGQIKLKLIAL